MWAVFEWFTWCVLVRFGAFWCVLVRFGAFWRTLCGDVMAVVIVMIYIVLYCIHMVNVGRW